MSRLSGLKVWWGSLEKKYKIRYIFAALVALVFLYAYFCPSAQAATTGSSDYEVRLQEWCVWAEMDGNRGPFSGCANFTIEGPKQDCEAVIATFKDQWIENFVLGGAYRDSITFECIHAPLNVNQ